MAENTKAAVSAKEATPEKKKKSGKGFFSRIGNFFKEYRSEMKKVVWYPLKNVIHDTGIVVAALVVTGVIIGALDLVFTKLVLILGQIGG